MQKLNRNPDKEIILQEQKENLKIIGELTELGWNTRKIQESFKGKLSRSAIQHYVTVHKLNKRADELVNERTMKLLLNSGIKFANCAKDLKKLNDEDFVRVLEYCSDPVNINLLGLSRDKLTDFVNNIIDRTKYSENYRTSELHDRLRDKIGRAHFLKKGIPLSIEVVLSKKIDSIYKAEKKEGLRVDLWGFKGNDCYGVEIKTNIDDFNDRIDRIREYSKYANYFYILTSDEEVRKEAICCLDENIGVLFYDFSAQSFLPEKSRFATKKDIEVDYETIENIKFNIYKKEVEKNITK